MVSATTLTLRREDVAYARAEAIVDAAAESKLAANSLKAILQVLHELFE
jgi:hypothetical protein